MDVDRATAYFNPGGGLARHLRAFEHRPQQAVMAGAVTRALIEGHPLMVEAGTGTGKSLAYLLPALLWAVQNNKRVIVSTYTKTLQEQILHQDIPLLQKVLPVPFRYALCLGHENYLSLRRLKRAAQTGLFHGVGGDEQMNDIFTWAKVTPTGIKSDLPFQPSPSVWEEVGRQRDLCLGKSCETHSQCFYFQERRAWYGAHLLVVNHHLFFANVANGWAVLPRCDAVIFDEAQNLEEAATGFLGLEASNSSLIYFLDRLYHPRTHRGRLAHFPDHLTALVKRQVLQTRRAVDVFFGAIFDEFGRQDRTLRFYEPPRMDNGLFVPLQDLHGMLKDLEARLEAEEDRLEAGAAAQRCFEFSNTFTVWLNQNLEGYVYWLEIAARRKQARASLASAPIHIHDALREQVFDKIERVVLTSATLTTQRRFDYIKERLGFEPKEEHLLDSPFDFPAQALLYLPEDLPEPAAEADRYYPALAARIEALIEATGGRAFVLFTSYDALNRVFRILDPRLRGYSLLKQGDLPPARMLRRFKETPAVIFGVNSFWQGVDIPGAALVSVIITKLPFDVPSDPLVEARVEDLKQKGISPFTHFQIPRAIIQLRQGFGRLIRTASDRGVVSILDSRMVHRGYGQHFLDSLPACTRTRDLEAVRRFMEAAPKDARPLDPDKVSLS